MEDNSFMYNLASMNICADIRKARLLLKSVTQTNPKNPLGWIAAARLEEVGGKMQAAQQLMIRACEECHTSEEVWFEACRLAPVDHKSVIAARGVEAVPNSVKFWMQAAELEHDDVDKSRVLRKGLQHIPHSETLWKALVNTSNSEDDAKTLLYRAVQYCPNCIPMWLSLARLEEKVNGLSKARAVLAMARQKNPNTPGLWPAAAGEEERLAENQNN